jgi:hypothetical protein
MSSFKIVIFTHKNLIYYLFFIENCIIWFILYWVQFCLIKWWGPERLRTGGWLLPGVMSDWQCGVDWILAKYCMWRLQLDLRCTGEERAWKVLALRGLLGVEGQVGSARWTRWSNGIMCGPHGSKKARWSHGHELVQGYSIGLLGWVTQKSKIKSWTIGLLGWVTQKKSMHAEFAMVHHKTVRLLGWVTQPRPEARRDPGAPRSFDAGGHATGSRGLRREDADCSEGVTARWTYPSLDHITPEGCVSSFMF